MRALRAARSYQYNRALKPKIEARLERAQSRLRTYLTLNGLTSMRLGDYQLELTDEGVVVTKIGSDGWEQLEIERMAATRRMRGKRG